MAHIINRAFVVHQGKRALSNFGKVPCLVGSNADLDKTDSALSLATGLSCDGTRQKETWQRDAHQLQYGLRISERNAIDEHYRQHLVNQHPTRWANYQH
ncbi:hypothetical protein PI124_g10675 [Phytophthora idaei]|nr:hypothetical protein PI125_g16885 [Phytophthora idaei]KAG3244540.1 hypothetical protein PI124_g10675 [Phytophthora idaei]